MKEGVDQNGGDNDDNNGTKTTSMKVESCVRVTLEENQTLIIPTGWIHAVYTPVDSIVIGGNFLHGLDIQGQLDIHCLETRTRVPAKFRFPYFVQLMFYAGREYYKRMVEPYGNIYKEEVNGILTLIEALRSWAVGPGGDADRAGSIAYTMQEVVSDLKTYGINNMEDFLNGLDNELKRIQANGFEKKPSMDTKENIEIVLSKNVEISSAPKLKLSLKRSSSNQQNVKAELNNAFVDDSRDEQQIPNRKISTKSKRLKIGDLSSKQLVIDDDEWLPDDNKEKSKIRKRSKSIKCKSLENIQSNCRKGRKPTQKQSENARSRLKKRLGI